MGVPRKERGVEKNEETKPHFFTIIVSPSLQLLKLRIPNKFVRDHSNKLSNMAYFRAPNGADWRVEVTKNKGDVWLNKGWKQFADYYSLVIGYLLVFRYDGNSRFRVLVFNTTTLEIDYSSNNLQPQLDGESSEVSASQRQSKIPSDAVARVQQRANGFESGNPIFMVDIRKRNLSCNTGPVFPVSHYRTYFKKRLSIKEIALCINEKTWVIQLRYEKFRPFGITMTFGWRHFVVDNDLKQGDICVFELIDSAIKTYNVHLFRI